jgi:oligoribonuclease NrnB/cAMP/cGMP phosphodiesterase (DHH superfamily)
VIEGMVRALRSVVVSHWDLDGLASAEMLTERFKPVRTILSSITAVPRNLLKAIDIIGYNGRILVGDLNPQPSHPASLRSIFEIVKERNIRVTWIDHHDWDRSIYRLFAEHSDIVDYLVDTSKVASQLIGEKYGFLDKPGFHTKLVDLAIDDDFFLNRYELTIMWRRILRWYGWETRYKALRSLLKHSLKPAWMSRLYYSEVKNLYENLIREAIGRADTYYTRGDVKLKIIVFPDVDPRVHPGEVTWIAKQNGLLADIYIVRYPRGVSLRSDAIDVSMIARRLGGGGHRNAAGIPGDISVTNIISTIDKLLPTYNSIRGHYLV